MRPPQPLYFRATTASSLSAPGSPISAARLSTNLNNTFTKRSPQILTPSPQPVGTLSAPSAVTRSCGAPSPGLNNTFVKDRSPRHATPNMPVVPSPLTLRIIKQNGMMDDSRYVSSHIHLVIVLLYRTRQVTEPI